MSEVFDLAVKEIFKRLKKDGRTLATAESCTGGLIAGAITNVPGSSGHFDRGFVTYTNEAKTDMLGVDPKELKKHGAVSHQVAASMAQGAVENSRADIAVSVTGIAGPDGGTKEKPVGLVYIGLAVRDEDTKVYEYQFSGDRETIREQTVTAALNHILDYLA